MLEQLPLSVKHLGIFILSVFPDVAAGAQGSSQNLGVTGLSFTSTVSHPSSFCVLFKDTAPHSRRQSTERERSWLKKENQNGGSPSLSSGFAGGSEVKASASNAGDPGSIPGSGRSPGEGNDNLLRYSCLENPMDGEAW